MTERYRKEFILQWHITHRCNLRCSHCYQEDYSAFSGRASLDRILDQFDAFVKKYGFRGHINITGGEPCLHEGLLYLMDEIRKKEMTCAVLTNGTMITDSLARSFKELGAVYVQVSLDGCEKVHDGIRGENSFRKAVSGILSLKKQEIDTVVSFTAQRHNIREFKKLSEYCEMLGVDKLWFDRVVISGDEDRDRLSVDKREYIKLMKQAAKLSKSTCVSCGRSLQFLRSSKGGIYSCSAGVSLLALLADGSVMPCRRLPITVGNVRESDISEIYENSDVINELKMRKIPDDCLSCRYAQSCRGGAKCISYAREKRYNIKDPDCMYKG